MPSKSWPSKSHSLLTETVVCGGGTSGRRERDAVLHDARAYAEHPPQRKEVRNVGWSSGSGSGISELNSIQDSRGGRGGF